MYGFARALIVASIGFGGYGMIQAMPALVMVAFVQAIAAFYLADCADRERTY